MLTLIKATKPGTKVILMCHVSLLKWWESHLSLHVRIPPVQSFTSQLALTEAKACHPWLIHHTVTFNQLFVSFRDQLRLLHAIGPEPENCVTRSYAMEALNAASLTPISVLCERRTEPGKISSLPITSSLKIPKPTLQECLSRSVHGGLVLLSSVISTGLAKALTYEEALQQSAGSGISDFDSPGVIDSVIRFAAENPPVLAGGATILGVSLVLSQVLKKPKPWGVESAKSAYAKLGEDGTAQLLDIRAPVEFRQVGTPDVGGLGKRAISIVYKGEDKPGFLKKLSLKFKKPENTTLFILDKFDGNSELVAELVAANGFKAAYAIKDGAEGPRGWVNSGLPWAPPKKALSLDLSNLSESIGTALGESLDGLSLTLGLAAATGLGFLAFSEIETILQLLGSAALVQLVGKKLLFAEDRKRTLKQVDEFLNTKIAPKELVDEIKDIGKALLPSSVNGKALPAPREASSEPTTPDDTTQKAESASNLAAELKPEPTAEPAPQVNSVAKAEVKAESLPGFSRPLSPYPSYPDFKPPTSPTPSQP